MVVPIVIGVGATIAALFTKGTISAYRKYIHLTPAMIASLNNIKLLTNIRIDLSHRDYKIHEEILRRYPERRGFNEKMTEKEALEILGIGEDQIMDFTKNDLKQRYRKMMILNHPDKSGSKYLAQKINQAKDVLDNSYMFNDEK